MEPHVPDNPKESWTNEKHVHFLNSMEASFVCTMIENNTRRLRLDRYLPDSSESTLDLKSDQRRTKKHGASTSVVIDVTRTGMAGQIDKRTRRITTQLYDPSQDQVVPQLGNRFGDRDEKDPSNLTVAPSSNVN